jgi:hypothetical protein
MVSNSDNTTRRNGNLFSFGFLKPLDKPKLYLISFKAEEKYEFYSEKVSSVCHHCFTLFVIKYLA